MTALAWKPWHKVKVRDDLKSGELLLAVFAADLYEVAMQQGRPSQQPDPQAERIARMPTAATFPGFVKDTFVFLQELAANNSDEWMNRDDSANKARYRRVLRDLTRFRRNLKQAPALFLHLLEELADDVHVATAERHRLTETSAREHHTHTRARRRAYTLLGARSARRPGTTRVPARGVDQAG